MTRIIFTTTLVGSAVALMIACSDDDANGTSGSGTGTGAYKQCGQSGQSGQSSCTEADFKPYTDCVQSACDAKYKECFGPNYQSGQFAGACGAWIGCTQKCGCGDDACQKACTQDEACKSCAAGFTCATSCLDKIPRCATGGLDLSDSGINFGGSDGGASCSKLSACCSKLTGEEKTQCESAVSLNIDIACSAALTGLADKCN